MTLRSNIHNLLMCAFLTESTKYSLASFEVRLFSWSSSKTPAMCRFAVFSEGKTNAMKTSHLSRSIEQFIELLSVQRSFSADTLVDRLMNTAPELEFDLRNGKLRITNWGREAKERVVENFKEVSPAVSAVSPWSTIVDIENGIRVKEVTSVTFPWYVEFVPTMPQITDKVIEQFLLDKLGYRPHTERLPEPIVVVPGHFWYTLDSMIQINPEVVEVVALESELPALLEHFEKEDSSDYRNCDSTPTG